LQVEKLHSATFLEIVKMLCSFNIWAEGLNLKKKTFSIVKISALIVTPGGAPCDQVGMLRTFEIQPLQEANLGMAHALFHPQRYLYLRRETVFFSN